MAPPSPAPDNESVRDTQSASILNLEQLRDITMDDADLMREIVSALIDDTSRQLQSLESAVREKDPQKTARLAHYSKGACANAGAEAAAVLLKKIERDALSGQFQDCGVSVENLALELDRLRSEAATL